MKERSTLRQRSLAPQSSPVQLSARRSRTSRRRSTRLCSRRCRVARTTTRSAASPCSSRCSGASRGRVGRVTECEGSRRNVAGCFCICAQPPDRRSRRAAQRALGLAAGVFAGIRKSTGSGGVVQGGFVYGDSIGGFCYIIWGLPPQPSAPLRPCATRPSRSTRSRSSRTPRCAGRVREHNASKTPDSTRLHIQL